MDAVLFCMVVVVKAMSVDVIAHGRYTREGEGRKSESGTLGKAGLDRKTQNDCRETGRLLQRSHDMEAECQRQETLSLQPPC